MCNNKPQNSIQYEKLKTHDTVNLINLFWIYQSTISVASYAQFSDRIITEYYSYTREDENIIGMASLRYVVGSKSFRPDIQKPRQMENAVRDIQCRLW